MTGIGKPENVALLLDYQNVHLVGKGLHQPADKAHQCVPDPCLIADIIQARRARPSRISTIRVYRGRPDPNLQPVLAASNDAQKAQWERDPASRSSDLMPAVETIKQLGLRHVEVACWRGARPLRLSGTNLPYCHFLTAADWRAVAEEWTGK